MKKPLVNIFVCGNGTHVHAVGWRVYERAGTYDELTNFLQSTVQHDHRGAPREDLKKPIPWRDFETMDRLNPFAGALAAAGVVGENPGYCVTHIVNGEVRVDDTFDAEGGGAVPDYLKVYSTEGGFDFPRLIQDDYFEAIVAAQELADPYDESRLTKGVFGKDAQAPAPVHAPGS